jgi:hypothetical protein
LVSTCVTRTLHCAATLAAGPHWSTRIELCAGRIVHESSSSAADTVHHGFLLSGNRFTSIDFPDATATEAYGINARG